MGFLRPYAARMGAWLISIVLLGMVVATVLFQGLLIYLAVTVISAWFDADRAGCKTHFGDMLTAYYRFRDGAAVARGRTKLWKNGIRMSFHQVESLSSSKKGLEHHVQRLISQHNASEVEQAP